MEKSWKESRNQDSVSVRLGALRIFHKAPEARGSMEFVTAALASPYKPLLRALPLYCRLSSILSLHCCHDLPSPLVCIQWTNAKPSMIQTRASETQIRTQASHLHFSKYRVPTLVRKWVITCFRVCVILSYLHVRSVITCLNHSHCVC